MVAVAEKKHAVLGPSGWHTWGTCPGSVPLSEGVPRKSSTYANEGTAAHSLLETCLGEGFDAEDLLGRQYEVEGEVFCVDNEMADAVNSTVDIVKSYLDEGAVLQIEQSVPLEFMTGEPDAEGTCDISAIVKGGTELIIADFKYGRGVQVYASEEDGSPNGQLAMYALGWLQKHGWQHDDITTVRLVVLQPRIEWVDECVLSLEELRAFEDKVREAAGRVELEKQNHLEGGADLTLNPGDKQCKFCAAKAFCPALKEHVSSSIALVSASDPSEFEDMTLPKKAASIVVNEGVTNERLAEFMRAIPLIEEAMSAARAEVERRLFAGQEIPGYYLGVGRAGNRKWTDEQAAIKELTKSGRLAMADALQKKPISPTNAEKAFKGRPKVWSQIAALIEQPAGKPSVCKEGDKNPRYELASPVSEFTNLDALSVADVMS